MDDHGETFQYPIVTEAVDADEGGGYIAYSPSFRGILGDGATRADAIEDVRTLLRHIVSNSQNVCVTPRK